MHSSSDITSEGEVISMGFELECDECKARFDEDDKAGRMEHIKEKHPEILQHLLEDVLDDYWSYAND